MQPDAAIEDRQGLSYVVCLFPNRRRKSSNAVGIDQKDLGVNATTSFRVISQRERIDDVKPFPE